MDRLVAGLEKGIVQQREHALFLTRVIGVGIFLAGLWFTPWAWKITIYSPFFVAPSLVVLERHLPSGWRVPDWRAQAAERRRIEGLLHPAVDEESTPGTRFRLPYMIHG